MFEESIGRPLNLNKGEMRNLIVKFESHAITLPIITNKWPLSIFSLNFIEVHEKEFMFEMNLNLSPTSF